MLIWFSLIIAILACVFLYKNYRAETIWWEYSIPILSTIILVLLLKVIFEFSSTYDIQHRGYIATDAKYYEYYETWVTNTCSTTTCDSKGENCVTTTYDCSYCSRQRDKYIVTDTDGNDFSVSKEYYNKLVKQWNATPEFIELNRNIDFDGNCGQDGDAYHIKWDNKPETSEATNVTKLFKNKLLATKSAFSYEDIDDEKAKKLGLYDYPKKYSYYKQNPIVGLEKLNIPYKDIIQKKFEYINGLGYRNKGKLYVLLYPDKNMDISFKQEAYWVGGKDNQLTVCIGYDSKTYKMTWVRAFSWDKNKKCIVDSREDLMEIGNVIEWGKIYDKMYKIMEIHKPRNFKDFEYLSIDIPIWFSILAFILTIGINIGICYWIIINSFKNN